MVTASKPELVRFAYLPWRTQGWLYLGDGERFATIERPWLPTTTPGGTPNLSCVPDGEYQIRRHNSPNFPDTFAIARPESGVWFDADDRPGAWGRFAILIHVGNFARDVEGCIAIGMKHTTIGGMDAVDKSHEAMDRLSAVWRQMPDSLTIRAVRGTDEIPAGYF